MLCHKYNVYICVHVHDECTYVFIGIMCVSLHMCVCVWRWTERASSDEKLSSLVQDCRLQVLGSGGDAPPLLSRLSAQESAQLLKLLNLWMSTEMRSLTAADAAPSSPKPRILSAILRGCNILCSCSAGTKAVCSVAVGGCWGLFTVVEEEQRAWLGLL